MKRLLLALTVVALSLTVSAAHADDFYDFTFTGVGGGSFSGSGVFDTVTQSDGSILIEGVTGSVTDGSGRFAQTFTISDILDPGAFPTGLFETPNDNILIYPPDSGLFGQAAFFDNAGVSFQLSDGQDINLNDTGLENAVESEGQWFLNTELDKVTVDFDHSTAVTPEPSSLLLLGTGVLSAAGLIRRRFLKA